MHPVAGNRESMSFLFSPIHLAIVAIVVIFFLVFGLCHQLRREYQQAAKAAREMLIPVQEKRSVQSQKNQGSEKGVEKEKKEKEQQKLYPSLDDLRSPSSESSGNGEEDLDQSKLQLAIKELSNKMENLRMRKEKGNQPGIKKEVPKREEPGAPSWSPDDLSLPSRGPPPYVEAAHPSSDGSLGAEKACPSFCPEVWREASMSFPVFQDAQGNLTHEALEFKSLKNLAKSVQSYGVCASFTLAIAMTPLDWQSTAKACLPMGTYLNWCKTVEGRQIALKQLKEEQSVKSGKRYSDTDWSGIEKSSLRKKQKKRWPETDKGPPGLTPSVPPPYKLANSGGLGCSFYPEVWRAVRFELQLACPVFQVVNYLGANISKVKISPQKLEFRKDKLKTLSDC